MPTASQVVPNVQVGAFRTEMAEKPSIDSFEQLQS